MQKSYIAHYFLNRVKLIHHATTSVKKFYGNVQNKNVLSGSEAGIDSELPSEI
jgi:hypothetical protein